MLNRITIMGRLVKDPELRRTQSGTSVCSFTVAVDRDFQSKDNAERQTDFIDVVAWRQTAEFICKYFGKGRMIVVDGSLQSRKSVSAQDEYSAVGCRRFLTFVESQTVYQGISVQIPCA